MEFQWYVAAQVFASLLKFFVMMLILWLLTDVILSPWPDEADSTGIKVRNIAYTLSLNYSIGPKYSPSTERQVS
jgi:hypothetical protein